MAEVEISYKGSTIASMNASGTKTLLTEGKYLEDDVAVVYSRPSAPSGTKNISITQNGVTTEDVTNYASAQITANVPNTYAAADEGKVVSNGALVAQGSDTVTQNNTYDTTLISSLTVNVSGGGASGVDITVASAKSGMNQCATALLNAANAVAGKTYVINAKTLASTSTNVLLKAAYVALESISASSCTARGGLIRNNTSGVTGSVAWGNGQCVITVGDVYTVTEVNNYPVL